MYGLRMAPIRNSVSKLGPNPNKLRSFNNFSLQPLDPLRQRHQLTRFVIRQPLRRGDPHRRNRGLRGTPGLAPRPAAARELFGRRGGTLPQRPLDSQSVAPAFATTSGVFEGMVMDINGFITDSYGNADFEAELDYNLLQPGDAPLVFKDITFDPLRDLDKQGMNSVGGHWKRVYPVDYNLFTSLQSTSPHTGRPQVERGTARGIVIAQHPDFITHGHTPGVFELDFFVPFSGDFPPECLP